MEIPMTDTQVEKQCSSCLEDLPAEREFFYSDKRRPDGLRNTCKACYAALPSVSKRRKEVTHV